MTLTMKKTVTVDTPVEYLLADCGVRYWEDATVNGVVDDDGSLIPLRDGDAWKVKINLSTGVIQDWPKGTEARIHYKVCDEGIYSLIAPDGSEVVTRDGYVPSMLCPLDSGHGDYVIMNIDGDGKIEGWNVDLSYFEDCND